MKGKNHWVLFAILLIALISLSPGNNWSFIHDEVNNSTVSPPIVNHHEVKESAHLKVAVDLEPEAFHQLQQASARFALHHHVGVELVNEYGKDTYAEFSHQFVLHDAPDIMEIDNAWIQDFAVKGYLHPANSYYTGIGNALSGLQAAGEWNGYAWSVPKDLDPYVLVYNSDVLDKLGFQALPEQDVDWIRLQELLRAPSIDEDKGYVIACDFSDPYVFLSLVHRLGTEHDTVDRGAADISTGITSGIKLLNSLRASMYDFNNKENVNINWSSLDNGRVAAVLVKYSEYVIHGNSNWKVEFPNHLPVERQMAGAGSSYVVSSDSHETEAANEWISAMTESSEEQSWFQTTGKLPASKALYQLAEYTDINEWIPDEDGRGLLWNMPIFGSVSILANLGDLSRNYLSSRSISVDACITLLSQYMKQARP